MLPEMRGMPYRWQAFVPTVTLLSHASTVTPLMQQVSKIDSRRAVHDHPGTLSVQVKEAIELDLYFPFLVISLQSVLGSPLLLNYSVEMFLLLLCLLLISLLLLSVEPSICSRAAVLLPRLVYVDRIVSRGRSQWARGTMPSRKGKVLCSAPSGDTFSAL